ncbi:hypothetical protein GAY31_19650 [Azospirillum brasilense]|nr:hypothetical protein [Azospirillum brasilense]
MPKLPDSDAEIIAWIEKNRPAISPLCGGGWVVELADVGPEDGQEYEVARTRGSLREAIKDAARYPD